MTRNQLICLAAFAAVLPGCSRETGVPVARVGQETLTREELESQLSPELARHAGREVYLDLARRWIRQKLLAQEARRLDLDRSEVVKKLLSDREDEVLADALQTMVLDSIPEADENQLRKYYEEHQKDFLRMEPEVGFRRIRFPDKPTALAKLEKLTPSNFASEAQLLQADPTGNDAQRMWRRSELPPGLSDILFSMTDGEISEPVQITDGWGVFLLVSKAPAGSVRPYQDVVDLIRVRLAESTRRRRLDDLVARLSRQGNIELLANSLPGADSVPTNPPRK
jgi:parvulin-like peptidyl-prolyl isomerase